MKPSKAELLEALEVFNKEISGLPTRGQEREAYAFVKLQGFLNALPDEPAPSPTKPMRVWDDTTKTYRWQDVEVSAPTKPEGLEWRGTSLRYNGIVIGHVERQNLSDPVQWVARLGIGYDETPAVVSIGPDKNNQAALEEAKTALEAAVRSWLSPVSDASDTVMEAAAEVIRLTDEYNERLSLYRKAPHLVPEPDSTAALAAFDRLRASLNTGGKGNG